MNLSKHSKSCRIYNSDKSKAVVNLVHDRFCAYSLYFPIAAFIRFSVSSSPSSCIIV